MTLRISPRPPQSWSYWRSSTRWSPSHTGFWPHLVSSSILHYNTTCLYKVFTFLFYAVKELSPYLQLFLFLKLSIPYLVLSILFPEVATCSFHVRRFKIQKSIINVVRTKNLTQSSLVIGILIYADISEEKSAYLVTSCIHPHSS